MKTTQRFAMSAMAAAVLLAMAGCGGMSTRDKNAEISTAPARAQGALPDCRNANFDQARGIFIVNNPAPDEVNQQCLLTVVSTAQAAASSAQFPAAPFMVEGWYNIEMSGGGGGGGGGASKDGGGGGGGAGAAPFNTIKLLSPGVYKLTLGKGGDGGKPGEYTQGGNPTSLTNYNTGEHIAGFEGADVWRQRSQAPGSGLGGAASEGGSFGGSGGDASNSRRMSSGMSETPGYGGESGQAASTSRRMSGPRSEQAAQSGGMSETPGYAGVPGQAGGETGQTGQTNATRNAVQADAGGGGGAAVGSGGSGDSATGGAATRGDLGGGGGGGSGHANSSDPGARGGHGFIRLALYEAIAPAPQVVAAAPVREPAPEVAAPAPVATPAPAAMRPAKKDRN